MIPQQPAERRALIGEYVLGLLDEAEAAEVRELIERDSEAAQMALQWQQHFLELSDQLPPQTPSTQLWQRLQDSPNRRPGECLADVVAEPGHLAPHQCCTGACLDRRADA